jgi:hypothetical protein
MAILAARVSRHWLGTSALRRSEARPVGAVHIARTTYDGTSSGLSGTREVGVFSVLGPISNGQRNIYVVGALLGGVVVSFTEVDTGVLSRRGKGQDLYPDAL